MTVFLAWLGMVGRMIYLGLAAHRVLNAHSGAHGRFAPGVYWMTGAMIASASLSHLLVRRQIGGAGGTLFATHLSGAILFVISLCLMRLFPGTTHPARHQRVAWFVLLPSLIDTAVTGPILMWRM